MTNRHDPLDRRRSVFDVESPQPERECSRVDRPKVRSTIDWSRPGGCAEDRRHMRWDSRGSQDAPHQTDGASGHVDDGSSCSDGSPRASKTRGCDDTNARTRFTYDLSVQTPDLKVNVVHIEIKSQGTSVDRRTNDLIDDLADPDCEIQSIENSKVAERQQGHCADAGAAPRTRNSGTNESA